MVTAKIRGRRVHDATNGPGIFLRGVRYLWEMIHETMATETRIGQYW
jgi:hypothetical protein